MGLPTQVDADVDGTAVVKVKCVADVSMVMAGGSIAAGTVTPKKESSSYVEDVGVVPIASVAVAGETEQRVKSAVGGTSQGDE